MAELSREGVPRRQGLVRGGESHFAPGLVTGFYRLPGHRVNGKEGTAQMVSEQVGERAILGNGVFPHGDAGCASIDPNHHSPASFSTFSSKSSL